MFWCCNSKGKTATAPSSAQRAAMTDGWQTMMLMSWCSLAWVLHCLGAAACQGNSDVAGPSHGTQSHSACVTVFSLNAVLSAQITVIIHSPCAGLLVTCTKELKPWESRLPAARQHLLPYDTACKLASVEASQHHPLMSCWFPWHSWNCENQTTSPGGRPLPIGASPREGLTDFCPWARTCSFWFKPPPGPSTSRLYFRETGPREKSFSECQPGREQGLSGVACQSFWKLGMSSHSEQMGNNLKWLQLAKARQISIWCEVCLMYWSHSNNHCPGATRCRFNCQLILSLQCALAFYQAWDGPSSCSCSLQSQPSETPTWVLFLAPQFTRCLLC